METAYFLDTYALIEIIKENKNYSQYKKGNLVTTKFNLMELHYSLLRTFGKESANFHYDRLLSITIEVNDEIIKRANEFKLKNREKGLSYVDCIGYIISMTANAKFLTGDKQFGNLENVEFVK